MEFELSSDEEDEEVEETEEWSSNILTHEDFNFDLRWECSQTSQSGFLPHNIHGRCFCTDCKTNKLVCSTTTQGASQSKRALEWFDCWQIQNLAWHIPCSGDCETAITQGLLGLVDTNTNSRYCCSYDSKPIFFKFCDTSILSRWEWVCKETKRQSWSWYTL